MPRLTGRTGAAFGLVCAAVLLFASISIGLRVPGTTFPDPFGSGASLDYRALRFGNFAPLRGDFIARELGSVIAESDVRRPSLRGSAFAPADGLRSVTADPLTITHLFGNDDFADAFAVTSVPFTARTNTEPATRQAGEPSNCGAGGGTAWYRYRAPRRIGLLANTFGSGFGTALGVYSGNDLSSLQRIACATDGSGFAQVAFPAQEGQTYWFQIAAPSGGGRLVFNLTLKGVTTVASASSNGRQGNGNAILPTISANGRFVSFYSAASFAGYRPPPPCQPSPYFDVCRPAVFLRDRRTHRIAHVDKVAQTTLGQPTGLNPTNDQSSITGSLSADGRFVAFYSGHTSLVEGDTNDTWDVFVRDQQRGTVGRVSVSTSGAQGNRASYTGSISADGRYIAFVSAADNLVPGDTNLAPDVFVRDLRTSKTIRVSVSSSGGQANLVRSPDFPLEAGSHLLALSANGRFVLFRSTASNLVAGDTNEHADVFVHDLVERTTKRVSVSSQGREADADSRQPIGIAQGAISNDGRYAFFNSNATNLVPNDTNAQEDLFVRNIVRGTTERVSVSSTGAQSNRGVGASDPFALITTTFTQVFLEPQNISQVAYSATPDGRYVAFSSDATNLVPGDRNQTTDIFLRDLRTGNTTIVSLASSGQQSNGASNSPALSADGRFIAYRSAASNLVPGDTNGHEDVFVYEIPGQQELSGWH
ncbi:MAG: hypothetical protein ACRDKJ_13180 [Actinomycetota bacterium]